VFDGDLQHQGEEGVVRHEGIKGRWPMDDAHEKLCGYGAVCWWQGKLEIPDVQWLSTKEVSTGGRKLSVHIHLRVRLG
jgi:hypothetical protein